jgi:hypothetical protein
MKADMDSIALSLAIIALVIALFAFIWLLLKRGDPPVSLPELDASPAPLPQRPLVLSVTPGAPKHGPYILPSLGAFAITDYHVQDYDEPLRCCTCGREFVEDESFWSIDIPDYPDGLLGVCTLCYGKAIA